MTVQKHDFSQNRGGSSDASEEVVANVLRNGLVLTHIVSIVWDIVLDSWRRMSTNLTQNHIRMPKNTRENAMYH